MNLLHGVCDKWYVIGLEIGFFPRELNQICSKPLLLAGAPTSFLTEILSQWIQWPTVNHPKKPTLGALCESLRTPLVGLGNLSDQIAREMKCFSSGKDVYSTVLFASLTCHYIVNCECPRTNSP